MGLATDKVTGKYNYKLENTKIRDFPRYDFLTPIKPQARYLTPLAWLLSYPAVIQHHAKIKRGVKGIKSPSLVLCNHNSFFDFKVLTAAIWPRRANYVVALDGFIGREGIMRKVGCIAKRKFVNDIQVIKQTANLLRQNQIVVFYPEARYSLIGTNSVLPESFGRMLHHLKVPVYTLMSHGHHIDEPSWNPKTRGVRTSAELELLFDREDFEKLDPDAVLEKVYERMAFDDFAWQRENKVAVNVTDRAEGLHRVLYQCPHCLTEYRMTSHGSELTCEACGKTWAMNIYGVLSGSDGTTEFSHAPDWFEWQKRNIRAEVLEGRYGITCEVLIDSLPNSAGFVPMGKATLTHDMHGFVLRGEHAGEHFEVVKTVQSLYSAHNEYNYMEKKMDLIDISTMDDTYFAYPTTRDASVTKMSLAVEELFNSQMG